MKFSSAIFSLCLGVSIQSCISVASFTRTNYTSIQPTDCVSKSDGVELFFEGEPINFSYSKLGIVEVRGSAFTDNSQFLDRLKYNAWMQCANGVIAITSQEINRDESEDERVFKGIAVAIEWDSLSNSSKILHQADTSFVQRVELQELEAARSMREARSVSTVLIILAGLISLIVSQSGG